MQTTDDIVSLSFDRFPSPKGAATHIDAFAKALGAEFGNVTLVTVPPVADDETGELPQWQAAGVTHCPLPADGASLFERVLAWRTHIWSWWKQEFGQHGRRPRVAHIRSIFEGYPIACHKHEFCEALVYEVNGLPSVELKYHYPAIADDRELLHKLRTQEQVCLEAADRIVTVSQVNSRHLISRGVDASKIRVIPNGVDLHVFQASSPDDSATSCQFKDVADLKLSHRSAAPLSGDLPESAGVDERPMRMLYVGTLSPWQGITHAVEALALYRRDWPATLTIAGPARTRERRELQTLAWKLGVFEFIELTGSLSKSELADAYRAADVVVAPLTRNDRNCDQGCCPLKVLEALATGTPLIASDLEVVRELCRDLEHALLVRPGSGKAIKDAMLKLRDDHSLSQHLSSQGRCHVEQQFGWETAQQRLINVYRELLP